MIKTSVSHRIEALEASATLVLVTKAKELAAQGKDVIALSVGEPDWPTFDVARKAAVIAIEENFTKYTPGRGILPLRQAIVDQVNNDYGTGFTPNHVTVATGGKYVIYSLLYSLINPGDEVIIPTPYWVSYPSIVQLCGGKTQFVQTKGENNFKITADELESSINGQSKVLILNSPSNPTGFLYTQSELDSLAKVIKAHPNLRVMCDDIYNRLSFDYDVAPHLLKSPENIGDQLFIVNGVSKTYSMTGWRVGWAVGDPAIMGAMGKFQGQTTSSVCSISQKAALAAIQSGEEELGKARKLLTARREFAHTEINAVDGLSAFKPDGAFYMWTDISSSFGKSHNGKKIKGSEEFAQFLLEDQAVVVVPGKPFGQEGYVRISYAISEERMTEALNRVKKFLKALA